MYSNWTSKISLYMSYIRTKINVLYKYKCSYTFFICTIDQCGSHDDKNTLYFGGLGQITDTITRF